MSSGALKIIDNLPDGHTVKRRKENVFKCSNCSTMAGMGCLHTCCAAI
jgi:hypothetical protein